MQGAYDVNDEPENDNFESLLMEMLQLFGDILVEELPVILTCRKPCLSFSANQSAVLKPGQQVSKKASCLLRCVLGFCL